MKKLKPTGLTKQLRKSKESGATLRKIAFLLIMAAFSKGDAAFSAPNSQVGGVTFETEKSGVFVSEIQDQTIALVEDFVKNPGQTPTFNSNNVNYLNSTYLYCTLTKGTCTLPLDALLEVDVGISKKSGKATCPTLTQFWTNWLKAGYEDKQKYNVKTAFLTETTQFTNTVRPKYIKCQQAVSERLSATDKTESVMPKFLEYLKAVRESKINVLSTASSSEVQNNGKKN